MSVTFKKVAWRNFLSYGNYWSTVSMNIKASTLIVGSNGSGKSTMLDALCFGLFGKPFRKITKPKIPNSINEKGTEVMVSFEKGGKTYIIKRTMKPDSFEIYIDNKKQDRLAKSVDQQKILETQILGFNQKSFTQIVVLGSATFQPFMQLSSAARRDVIEDLLDISIIGDMATIVKRKAGNVRSRISDASERIRILEERERGKIDLISQMRRASDDALDALKTEHNDIKAEGLDKTNQRLAVEKQIKDWDEEVDAHASLNAQRDDAEYLMRNHERDIKSIRSKLERMGDTPVCSECGQPINEEEHAASIANLNAELAEHRTKSNELEVEIAHIDEAISEINLARVDELKAEYSALSGEITGLVNQAKRIKVKIDNHKVSEDTAEVERELEEIRADIRGKNAKLDEERRLLQHVNAAGDMLKDEGIKAKIIATYLPVINTLVNKYLEEMGFNVSFHLDDQFTETIKSRHRDKFSYFSFSEGEKQRIDLALLFTWREIARLRNSANTNVIIMDEVMDGSLDQQGLKDFIRLLGEMKEGTSSFIISHNPDFVPQFDRILKAEKSGGFSRISDNTENS